MTYQVRMMQEEDVEQVNQIDREAFPTQWPAPDYRRELHARLTHHIVVCENNKPTATELPKEELARGIAVVTYALKHWLDPDRYARSRMPVQTQHIIGFASIWVIADEAHLTNIAVMKTQQRQGVGELILLSALNLAMMTKADFMTLEVRVSNLSAQSLYRKYGFAEVGLRHGYYTDNREDALLMSTASFTSASYQELFRNLKEAYFKRHGYPVVDIQPVASS